RRPKALGLGAEAPNGRRSACAGAAPLVLCEEALGPAARSRCRRQQVLQALERRRGADGDEDVAWPDRGVGRRLGVELCLTAQTHDHRASSDVADRLSSRLAALPGDNLLEAVLD